jgi:hypothetical protein
VETLTATIFLDIDGCLIWHNGSMSEQMSTPWQLLPGVKEKLVEWDRAGHRIILTTGRREGLRRLTEELLVKNGIFYDLLIMGLPRGPRVVINDCKPASTVPTAIGISVPRNEGLGNVSF